MTREDIITTTELLGYKASIWKRNSSKNFSFEPATRAQIGHVIATLMNERFAIEDIATAIGCSTHTAYRYARYWCRNVNREAA